MKIDKISAGTTYAAVVGRLLQQQRERLQLDQSAVAQAVGVTQSTWSRVEKGESALTMEQLANAAERIETTPGKLITLADDAVAAMRARGVIVRNERPSKTGDNAIALIGAAALGALIAKLLSK